MAIRRATADDAVAMAKIDKLVFSIPWSTTAFKTEFDYEGAVYFIAEADGKTIGYAGMRAVDGIGDITNIAVHPDYRRMGIGSRLVKSLIDEKLSAYTLEVRKSNEAAIRLYESFGFYPEGIRKGYYQDDHEDAVIMWKR